MNSKLYPLLFKPVYMDYIWGGNKIPEIFNRSVEAEITAESWEISDRPEGMSIVSNGEFEGTSLQDMIKQFGSDLLGNKAEPGSFPLLIKIIDAKKCLSVQVHPNDETASLHGGEAKTEMWYVLDGTDDAQVYAGLTDNCDKELFKSALESEKLETVLSQVPAKPGESIYIPGGRVHAIDKGCLLLEVQQNSNTTYRVYDWGRVGHDGNPRPLHIEEALKVIDFNDDFAGATKPVKTSESDRADYFEILSSPYFHLVRIDLKDTETIRSDNSSFHAIFTAGGKAVINSCDVTLELPAGTSCLIPAAIEEYSLEPVEQKTSIIQISLP